MKFVVWDWKAHFNHQNFDQVHDVQLAEFLLSYGRPVADQNKTLEKYQIESVELLAEKQQKQFDNEPELKHYLEAIELPMVPVLWQMEQAGIYLDCDQLKQVASELDTAIATLSKHMITQVGEPINLNSAVQIGTYLAEKLGVPLAKTKTGRYATNEAEISQFAEQFSFIQDLLEYRELSKLRSTYVDNLIDRADAEGRVHTTYSLVAASTGRLSSNNPNLQNIPSGTGFGQRIKSCFKASKGNILLSFDYSQQELRVLAHLTKEPALIKAFQDHQDIHTSTAAKLFSVDYKQVTKEQRMVAKTINFGVVYGMSSFGMSSQLHIPVEEAQAFINAFYATYPAIKKFYDGYLEQAKKNGYVSTILGRKRYVFEIPQRKFIDNAMRRVLINYPIQGSAADLMKKAMIEVHQQVVVDNPSCKLLLQIHDDLVFEVPDKPAVIASVAAQVKQIMCNIYPLDVPIEVDVKIGHNWGELKPYQS